MSEPTPFQSLRAINIEANAFSTCGDPIPDADYIDHGIDPLYFGLLVCRTFDALNQVVSNPIDRSPKSPYFPIVRRAWRYGQNPARIPVLYSNTSDHFCLDAEPRMLLSITNYERATEQNKILESSVVMLDSTGRPFACQDFGGPLTYVWRRANFGRYVIPADCWVSIRYKPGADPRKDRSNVNFLAAESEAVSSVMLGRLGASLLPKSVLQRAANIKRRESLPAMRPRKVGQRISALLRAQERAANQVIADLSCS